MRSSGRDIVELFGFAPNDLTPLALKNWNDRSCPFTQSSCSKTNHDKSVVYGVCSVTSGSKSTDLSEVIVCPKRLYGDNFSIFDHVAADVWPNRRWPLVAGGSIEQLKKKALSKENCVAVFGQGSGREFQINANGKLSMDWVLQSHEVTGGVIRPLEFVGVEVQSIDTTNNYRDCWSGYERLKIDGKVSQIPESEHGLNWANVHKRLIPQIIRKGAIYSKIDRCAGFYFIVPTAVYAKFEQVIGPMSKVNKAGNDVLSVMTVDLDKPVGDGQSRSISVKGITHYLLGDIAAAFIANASVSAHSELDDLVRNILR